MSGVHMTNVNKRFDAVHVIHDVNLDIEPGEFTVFVGPSGCGKSTLLRMVAGLEEISDGEMSIGGKVVNDVDPANRGIAMVFQSYALYPHMTVEDNMGFGLRMAGMPKAEIHERVMKAAKILQLDHLLDRRPKALSGGQRQRVAIGRAIVRDPQVFLFDEPLSNLDAELRVETRVQIAKLHQELGATMIYVTHDQVEAMTLADKIVVLRAGRVEQVGSPLNLYDNPDNRFVAGFIGSPKMNFMAARAGDFSGGKLTVELTAQDGATVQVPLKDKPPASGAKLELGIRPEHFVDPADGAVSLNLTADVTEHLGGASFIHGVSAAGEKLVIEQRGFRETKPGDVVKAAFMPQSTMLFDENGMRLR